MRIRSIKPEWLHDQKLSALSDSARLMSLALIVLADDYGRGRADLKYLAAQVWPHSGSKPTLLWRRADVAVTSLESIGFLTRYHVGAEVFYQLRTWNKHQRVQHPGKMRIPPPPEVQADTVLLGGSPETLMRPSGDPPETLTLGEGEGVGSRDLGERAAPPRETRVDETSGVRLRPPADLVSQIIEGVAGSYESMDEPPPKQCRVLTWEKWVHFAAWCIEKAEMVGMEPIDVAARVVQGFFKNPRAKAKGWPITFLVENPAEYWRAA